MFSRREWSQSYNNGNLIKAKLMEIRSPYPKPTVCLVNSASFLSNRKHHPHNIRKLNTTVTVSVANYTNTSNSPIQIQRPHLRKLHPIKPPKNTITTTTTSDVLRLMDSLGLRIPIEIYVSLIKECADTRDAAGAVELHTHIGRSGLRRHLPLLNRLLLMYISCGCMENAHQLFDEMTVKDANSWAAMIAGYANNDDHETAIDLFIAMQKHHTVNNYTIRFPVSWILVCILKSCVHTKDLELGKQIHSWLLKVGYCKDLFLSSSLINFYGKVRCLDGADFVFDHISHRNTVVWTARIVNNCREERFDDVLNVFMDMGREGVKKNSFTFSSVLKACGKIEDGGRGGRQVHANAIKLGLVSKSYVQCGLVDMYGKFGFVKDARRVFEMNGDKRNAACWNAMLTCYIQHGFCIEAIKILYEMNAAGLQPQESLLNEVRSACGSTPPENRTDAICI